MNYSEMNINVLSPLSTNFRYNWQCDKTKPIPLSNQYLSRIKASQGFLLANIYNQIYLTQQEKYFLM